MNYMKQVAEMLGVEMGERFKMRSVVDDIVFPDNYRLTDEGVMREGFIVPDIKILTMILTGEFEIVKKAWKPKPREQYYYVRGSKDIGCVGFNGSTFDFMCVCTGNCFRTYADAEAHRDEVMAKFKAVMD